MHTLLSCRVYYIHTRSHARTHSRTHAHTRTHTHTHTHFAPTLQIIISLQVIYNMCFFNEVSIGDIDLQWHAGNAMIANEIHALGLELYQTSISLYVRRLNKHVAKIALHICRNISIGTVFIKLWKSSTLPCSRII